MDRMGSTLKAVIRMADSMSLRKLQISLFEGSDQQQTFNKSQHIQSYISLARGNSYEKIDKRLRLEIV